MKHFFLTLTIFSLSFINSQAQDFKGIAEYQSKTKFEMELDSTRIPKDRMADFKAMMKNQMEKKYILTFNKTESLYSEEEKLEQPGMGRGGFRFGGISQGLYYKNLKSKTYARQIESFSKDFLVKDSLPLYQWKMEDETKMIGEHLCFKATATKEVREMQLRTQSKPEDKPEDAKLKTITVTAWYTPEIPINNGPSDYWGLPGLILELNEDKTQFVCTKIVLNSKDVPAIKEPEKGKVVTQKEYDKIMEDKMKEMQEMYGGEQRKGEGGGGQHRMIIRM